MKTVLITESKSGIGRKIKEKFALDHDWEILEMEANVQNYNDFAEELYHKSKDCCSTFAKTGVIDLLINASEIFRGATLEETLDPIWDILMNTNVKGVYHTIKACLPHLKKSEWPGAILNVICEPEVHLPENFTHTVSQCAVYGITEFLHEDLKNRHNISLIGISYEKFHDTVRHDEFSSYLYSMMAVKQNHENVSSGILGWKEQI